METEGDRLTKVDLANGHCDGRSNSAGRCSCRYHCDIAVDMYVKVAYDNFDNKRRYDVVLLYIFVPYLIIHNSAQLFHNSGIHSMHI